MLGTGWNDATLGLALAALTLAPAAWAQNDAVHGYPDKPIRLIVPTAPGGGVDTLTRIVGQKLTEAWGQQAVIDNRGGASGIIGTEIAARAPADGYTLLVVPTTFSVNVSLFKKLPYDPRRDFIPISLLSKEPNVLMVHPSLPVRTVAQLIALAKRKPDQLNYSYGGNGSSANLSAEMFKLGTGIKAVGLSYKGAGPAVTALASGEAQFMFIGLPPTFSLLKAGKLRALAVTSRERSPLLPQLPTMIESGLAGFEVTNWIGLMAPAATPSGIIRKLNAEIVKILSAPDTKKRFAQRGVTSDSSTPEEFRRFLDSEMERWGRVVRAAGIPVN